TRRERAPRGDRATRLPAAARPAHQHGARQAPPQHGGAWQPTGASAGYRGVAALRFALFVALAEVGDHRRVGERGGVAQRAALGDVAEEPAHDLGRARLGQLGGEEDLVRAGDGADRLRHLLAELVLERLAGGDARAGGDEARDALALDLVADADHRGLRHPRVADERAFDLHGAETVAGHVEHVVHAAEQPEVAVIVAAGAVAGEVLARVLRPVLVGVARIVAPDGAHHRRPGAGEDQVTAGVVGDRVAGLVEDLRLD